MKKKAIIVLCLALVFTLIGCGNNAQSSDEHNAKFDRMTIPKRELSNLLNSVL